MIKKVLKGKRYRLLRNRWEVSVIEVVKNTYVVSANDEVEALDKMEMMSKPTYREELDSVVDVVRKITYS
tara:strand:+ start:950 stop:1159 length:210 start_codon:yes stop_codon:yes gene_type:complete